MNKQEKPVVPQFVADWYEEHKDNFEYSIQCLCVHGCLPVRKINGETQREFAENFGRHYRTVQNWELDHSVPDVFTAMALAEYYNMTVEELVNGEDDYDKEL